MKKTTILGCALLLGPFAAFLLPLMEDDECEEESYEEMQDRRYDEDGYY